MKKILVVIMCTFFASQAFAIGHVNKAKVVKIRVDGSGKVMIFFDQKIEGSPTCVGHEIYKWALAADANTEGGKAVLSMALTAKTTGASVTVNGLGVCGVYGGQVVETWNYGSLH